MTKDGPTSSTFAVLSESPGGTRTARPGASAGMPCQRRRRRRRPMARRGTLLPPPLQLFALSFLMLFVELALIRWSGALVVYLSYFSNFVLLGSFLGIGIGFLRARARVNLFPWCPGRAGPADPLRAGVPGRGRSGPGTRDHLLRHGTFHASGPPAWVTLPVVFLAVAAVMAMIGEGVARTFIRFRPLDAYRLDIVGSLAGIAAFSLLSFLGRRRSSGRSSWRWSCCCSTAAGRAAPGRRGRRLVHAALVRVAVVRRHLVALLPHLGACRRPGSVLHQRQRDPAPEHHPGADRRRSRSTPSRTCDAPGRPAGNVLIVGAGTGDDVAIALPTAPARRRGGDRPALYQLGGELSPTTPTRTRASPCTSPTAARSWSGRTRAST